MDNARKKQQQILAGVEAQAYLMRLEREVADLRARFRQWCLEAEIGLRMLLDGHPLITA